MVVTGVVLVVTVGRSSQTTPEQRAIGQNDPAAPATAAESKLVSQSVNEGKRINCESELATERDRERRVDIFCVETSLHTEHSSDDAVCC
uniref:Putative secreted peptide n=1 Tax=Anopheles braziliensis TaxID=58242 RepID=A0A2M3ZTU5_9DIPT